MGPELASKCVADGLAWAQHWPKNILPMALYGPSTGHKIYCQSPCMGPELASTDCLAWAQHWSQHLLPKTLYGPNTCCRGPCMGPTLVPKYGADGLVWVQHWLQNVPPVILYGPSTGPKLCYRWSYMGPSWSHMCCRLTCISPALAQNILLMA